MIKSNIKYQIEQMNNEDLIILNNLYVIESNLNYGTIKINNEIYFNTNFLHLNPFEIVQMLNFGHYDSFDQYVRINSNMKIQTIEYITTDYLCDSIKNISTYINNNFSKFQHLFN